MRILKCLAIDDEPLALDIIKCYCGRLGNIELEVFADPEEALSRMKQFNPDILFLDIEMKEMSGLEIASQDTTGASVIFTTAHPEFALEGFNLDAVDYLHKPFSYERFLAAIEKAKRRLQNQDHKDESIVVKQEYSNVKIKLDSILYVEAMESYVKIFMNKEPKVMTRMALKKIIEMLPPEEFLRIHRSYVVSLACVRGYTRQYITLSDGTRLPVGRMYANLVVKALKTTQ